ncbi:MAG: hypothetical protein ACYSUQ_04410, partial [Planctomycetota bacterium]
MRLGNLLPALVAAVVYTLCDANRACAWGPGIHLSLAGEVLNHAAWLPAALAGVITRYARDYFYG